MVQFIFYFWPFEISRNILRNQKNNVYTHVRNRLFFSISTPFGLMSVFASTLLLKSKTAVCFFLAFIASSLRVSDENLLFETDLIMVNVSIAFIRNAHLYSYLK